MTKIDAFWDSSALAPLCVKQGASGFAGAALRDKDVTVWWGTPVEIKSALCRLRRDGAIGHGDFVAAVGRLAFLKDRWVEVLPTRQVRAKADLLLENHPLRAADALQLAAALVWSGKSPAKPRFVCADGRLAEAARREGFPVETP